MFHLSWLGHFTSLARRLSWVRRARRYLSRRARLSKPDYVVPGLEAGASRWYCSPRMRRALQRHDLYVIGWTQTERLEDRTLLTLMAGDIAIIGLAGDTSVDEFSWVPLTDLTAGEEIYFSDAGYREALTPDQFDAAGFTSEFLVRYTVPFGGVPAGTVQAVASGSEGVSYTFFVNDGVTNLNKLGYRTSVAIGGFGEQIHAFQSTDDPTLATFSQVDFTGLFAASGATTNWGASTHTTNSSESNLHPDLTNGTNAVAAGSGAGASDEFDNVRYMGTRTGDAATLLAAISNNANWQGTNTNGLSSGWSAAGGGGGDFTVSAGDTMAPAVTSIARQTPASSPTNADSLTFRVTFDEDVQNVGTADFAVTGTTGTVTGVSEITASTVYDVTVSGGDLASLNGTVDLNIASGNDIQDTSGNALGNSPAITTEEMYVVDNTAPELAISRMTPAGQNTNADSLIFRAQFNSDMANVDAGDFDVVGTTATITSFQVISGTSIFDITVSGGDLAGLNGTVELDLDSGQDMTDLAGNALNTTLTGDESYTVDNTAPTVTSIERQSPSSSPTNADSLVYRITFAEGVMNVGSADFDVTGTTAGITNVAIHSPTLVDVTVSGGDLASVNATVDLDFAAGNDIADLAGNALGATPAIGTEETYTVDNTGPVLTAFARNNPATSPTNADSLVFDITFDGSVTNVDATDFDITGTMATGVLAGSGASYTLTVSGGDLANLNGTVGLNLAAGQNIADAAGNSLGAGEPATDETYAVDNDAPGLTSFARQTPAGEDTNADTLVFAITFDESVSN
ncbi:MAG: beta strand repeat-containing protein, partial [Planctomycetota bacterium]